MNELQQILEQYNQILHGEPWYGDPVWKILEGVDAECAAAQTVAPAHTIWQLVMHMAFWEDIATRRLSGPVTPDESGNFPDTPAPEEQSWRRTLDQFRASNEEFRAALSQLDSAGLGDNIPGGQRSFRYEAMGVIEHHIYHGGQIALLKKAYRANR